MPKTVGKRRHCEENGEHATIFRNPKNQDVGRGLRKIVACSPSSSQCLLVPTVFGTVSSIHPISFLMIFILVLQFFYAGLAFDTI